MKLFCSGHHWIEILFPTAVPTQHLDEHRQPHFPMTPNLLVSGSMYTILKQKMN